MAAGACRVGLSVTLTCCVLKDLCSLFVNNCCLCQVQNLLSSGEHRVQNMCAMCMDDGVENAVDLRVYIFSAGLF